MGKKLAKKKKNVYFFLFFVFILVGFSVLVYSIIHKIPQLPKDVPQFTQSGKTLWSTDLIFGEENKTLFPVISSPKYVTNKAAGSFLEDNDVLYIFSYNNQIYAYPGVILSFHHIVNDTIDQKPVVMTLCLLSGSAAVYNRKIGDTTLSFGVLGSLYNGNLIMYDENSNSYWLQLTGDGFEGLMTNKKLTTLTAIESVLWKDIKNQENLKVLPPVRDMKFYREFYQSFLKSPFGIESLNGRKQDPRLEPFTNGIGITVQNDSVFYPAEDIAKKGITNDTVGTWKLVIVQDPELNTLRVFRSAANGKELTFAMNGNFLKDDETGSTWNTNGLAVEGRLKGAQLSQPVYTEVYWYSWSAFYPSTRIVN